MSRPRKYKGNAKQRKLAANRAWQRANPDKARAATRAYRKRILRLAKLAIAAGLQ